MKMTSMSCELSVGKGQIDLEVEFEFNPGLPGYLNTPPEPPSVDDVRVFFAEEGAECTEVPDSFFTQYEEEIIQACEEEARRRDALRWEDVQ